MNLNPELIETHHGVNLMMRDLDTEELFDTGVSCFDNSDGKLMEAYKMLQDDICDMIERKKTNDNNYGLLFHIHGFNGEAQTKERVFWEEKGIDIL